MIKISALTFNPFMENTYVVSASNGECMIVDAGCYSPAEQRELQQFISDNGLRPVMAVNTHGHVDHMLGVEYVKQTYSIPFAMHGDDRFLIESAAEHGKLYGFNVGEIPTVDIDLKGEPELELGGEKLRLIHTPGHTPGHVCIFDPEGRQLLSGDTLFRESIGRTDLPGGDYSWIMRSILEKIMPLGADVTLYPGHGPESTLGHEALYNPFIVEVVQGEVNF